MQAATVFDPDHGAEGSRLLCQPRVMVLPGWCWKGKGSIKRMVRGVWILFTVR